MDGAGIIALAAPRHPRPLPRNLIDILAHVSPISLPIFFTRGPRRPDRFRPGLQAMPDPPSIPTVALPIWAWRTRKELFDVFAAAKLGMRA